jgi:RHS repeat-associated protein
VVALLEADDTQGTAGRCVERYAYSPYGEFLVLKGEGASGNLGSALVASTVGNPFTHQGLPFDQEKGSYQNRSRDLHASIQRFAQRDPLGGGSHARGASYDGPSLFLDRRANPVKWRDWDGRCVKDDVRSKGFFRECCRTSGHQGTQFCTDCEVCLCGDDYVNIANEWRDTKDPVCGACTYDTYPPYPTCGKAAKSAPQVCCNFYNQPTEEDCKDCCLIIQGEGKDPPPYWEVFVGMCMNACSVYHPK